MYPLKKKQSEVSKTPIEIKYGNKEIWMRKTSLLRTPIEKVYGEIIQKLYMNRNKQAELNKQKRFEGWSLMSKDRHKHWVFSSPLELPWECSRFFSFVPSLFGGNQYLGLDSSGLLCLFAFFLSRR